MSKLDSGVGSRVGGVIVKQRRSDDLLGVAFQTARTAAPSSSNDFLLYRRGNALYVWDGSAETQIGGGGGAGATPTWETLFGADATFTLTPDTTFTIAGNRATATDVFTLTNIGGGSGNVIQITNSGTGKDINGTSSTWSVTKAGAAVFAGVSISGTASALATTGAAVWTLLDNNAAGLTIGSAGATSIFKIVTTDGSEAVVLGNAFTVTDGLSTLGSTSNTAQALLVTNNTVTTFGAGPAASAGVAVFRSTSLTTGVLMKLQLTEGTLNGGWYLECFDVTAGGQVFTIGEDGATTITGVGGSNVLTLTGGDQVLSDGSITITDADNAATFSVTNNTATTASVFAFAGSGVFTGSTTTSFFTITPSGLTSGTAVYLPVAGLTTGKALHVVANAVTSGLVVNITSSATAITGAGRLFAVNHTGITGTSAVLSEFSSAATDETIILQVTASAALAAGKVLFLSAAALTTGTILDISGSVATTTGTLVNINDNSADTGTRSLVKIKQDHASATGATPLELLNDNATRALIVGTATAQSTNYYRFATINGVTIWMGNGTGANGVLSGTAGDILINGASNKPEYCTGTTTWVALV